MKTKAPYGYRRVWRVPFPPSGNWGRPNNAGRRQAARMRKAGPKLVALTAEPARLRALSNCNLERWDGSAGSNWDLYPASILVSVAHLGGGREEGKALTFTAQHGLLRGAYTTERGVGFFVNVLVTRGGRDMHRAERLDLAAALRDAAELLERT